jgi:hypothetical protein
MIPYFDRDTTILPFSQPWTNQMSLTSFLKGRRIWHYVTGDITKSTPIKDEGEVDVKFIEHLDDWARKKSSNFHWSIFILIDLILPKLRGITLLIVTPPLINPFYCYQLIQNLNQLHQQLEQYVIDFQSQMQFFQDQLTFTELTWKNVDDALVFIIYRDHHHRTHQ